MTRPGERPPPCRKGFDYSTWTGNAPAGANDAKSGADGAGFGPGDRRTSVGFTPNPHRKGLASRPLSVCAPPDVRRHHRPPGRRPTKRTSLRSDSLDARPGRGSQAPGFLVRGLPTCANKLFINYIGIEQEKDNPQ